jgi:hypothetical protein
MELYFTLLRTQIFRWVVAREIQGKFYIYIIPGIVVLDEQVESLFKVWNVSDKSSIKNQNTHFMFINFSEIRAAFEIMWENMVQLDRPQLTM